MNSLFNTDTKAIKSTLRSFKDNSRYTHPHNFSRIAYPILNHFTTPMHEQVFLLHKTLSCSSRLKKSVIKKEI